MPCCRSFVQPFNNAAITSINYTQSFRDIYGNTPNVQVYYADTNGEYYRQITPAGISLAGNPVDTVTVNHGSGMTGFLKIA